MIGSLIFYALLPLSRYLSSQGSNEASTVVVSGAAVLDVGAITPSQTTVVVRHGPNGEETEEGMKKKSPTMEENIVDEVQTKPGETKDEGTPGVTEEDLVDVLGSPAEEQFEDSVLDAAQSPNVETNVVAAESKAEPSECWDEYIAEEVTSCGSTSVHLRPESFDDDSRCPAAARTWDDSEELSEIRRQKTFEETKSESSTQPEASLDFTVMSYNILAQDLLETHEECYLHCPLEVLDWNYRCKVLLEEIQQSRPDILCLQEVQENHYHNQLFPALKQFGYTCVFKRRTGTKSDGCATCYRSSRFTEVSTSLLEFYRPETGLLDRHNVAVVLLLEPTASKPKRPLLCVANTHLLFNPSRGDVKLAQLGLLLAEVDHMSKSCKDEGRRCDIVLCGDFNSLPQSPLYQLVTTGELYLKGLPTWLISGQEEASHHHHTHRVMSPWPSCLPITNNCQYVATDQTCAGPSLESGRFRYSQKFLLQLRFCPPSTIRPPDLPLILGVTNATPDDHRRIQAAGRRSFTVSHRFDLESVYKHVHPVSGAPEVTTLHSQAGATVDYIFFTPKRSTDGRRGLTLLSCLSLPCEDVLWSLRGLPNHTLPSDHLSLLAKFQMDLRATCV